MLTGLLKNLSLLVIKVKRSFAYQYTYCKHELLIKERWVYSNLIFYKKPLVTESLSV